MFFVASAILATVSSAILVQASPIYLSSLTSMSGGLAQVITECTVPGTAALTFDDGPYEYIQNISKSLTDVGAKGTFFFNGNNYRCIYAQESVERVQFAYGQGHQIGSHTWAHKNLSALSTAAEVDSEMARTEQAIQRLTGAQVAFTRPPYGEYNDNVRQVAAKRNQKLVNWSFDSRDSIGATPAESNAAYDKLVQDKPSSILALNHEVYNTTAFIVAPHAIKVLLSAGYKLVTVADCLGQQPYLSTGPPTHGTWSC